MERALTSLVQQQSQMVTEVVQLAEQCSGSLYLEGLSQVSTLLEALFAPLGADLTFEDLAPRQSYQDDGEIVKEPVGSAMVWRQRVNAHKRVLLVGHMDTVFAANDPFQQVSIDGDIMRGPGVADMKGGLVVMLHALKALEQMDDKKALGWDVVITPDEEIGSASSMPLLETLAKEHEVMLVFEPALDDKGTLSRARRGSAKYTLIVQGRSAHVGRAFKDGVNAIYALAQVAQFCHELNEADKVIVNVGCVHGGTVVNRVPDKALARLDVRFSQHEDIAWFEERLQDYLQSLNKQPGLQVTLHGGVTRPAKVWHEKNAYVYSLLQQAAHDMNLHIDSQDTGGCCDGNNLSQYGGVIDTLGVRGGGIHSDKEYMVIASLLERSMLTLRFLQLWAQDSTA